MEGTMLKRLKVWNHVPLTTAKATLQGNLHSEMQIQTLLNVSNENASFIKQKKKYFLKESNEVMGKWSLFPEQISALNSVL